MSAQEEKKEIQRLKLLSTLLKNKKEASQTNISRLQKASREHAINIKLQQQELVDRKRNLTELLQRAKSNITF